MNRLVILAFIPFVSFASDNICYDERGEYKHGYLTQAPKGWFANFKKGQEMGVCVIYSSRANFHDSEAIIYPRLMAGTPGSKSSYKTVVSSIVRKLRSIKPDVKIKRARSLKSKQSLPFSVRHYLQGPAPQEFEAAAYHHHENSVFFAVLSTRSRRNFEKHKNRLEEFVGSVKRVDQADLKKEISKINDKLKDL